MPNNMQTNNNSLQQKVKAAFSWAKATNMQAKAAFSRAKATYMQEIYATTQSRSFKGKMTYINKICSFRFGIRVVLSFRLSLKESYKLGFASCTLIKHLIFWLGKKTSLYTLVLPDWIWQLGAKYFQSTLEKYLTFLAWMRMSIVC
jgi:hypothetical protein